MLKFVNKDGAKVMEVADNGDVKITEAFIDKTGEMTTKENVTKVKDEEE